MHQLAFQHRKHRDGEALGGFQNDVADEAVANDDVNVVLEQIVALDIADEIQIKLLAKLERRERKLVALGFFRADAQNADARSFASKNLARINTSHHRELREMKRLALDVRTGVQQDKFISLARDDRSDAAAVHAVNPPDFEGCRRENAAGVAERNQRVGLAVADQLGGTGDGGILFFAERDNRFVVHRHHFAGVNHFDAVVAKAARRQCCVDGGLVADEVERGNFFVGFERQLCT